MFMAAQKSSNGKGVWGIRIKYPKRKTVFRVDFSIQKRRRSFLQPSEFISNKEIREAIGEYLKTTVKIEKFGYMRLSIKSGNVAQWNAYYPADRRVFRTLFLKKGISQLLELITIKELKRRFPEIKGFQHV